MATALARKSTSEAPADEPPETVTVCGVREKRCASHAGSGAAASETASQTRTGRRALKESASFSAGVALPSSGTRMYLK